MLLDTLDIAWQSSLQALFWVVATAFVWFLYKLYNVRSKLLAFRKQGLVCKSDIRRGFLTH